MAADHIYQLALTENDPVAEQPERVRTPLKPHQLTALAKALQMERHGRIFFDVNEPVVNGGFRSIGENTLRGRIKVTSNVGILGDIVGYGKTLTALSIIAANGTRNIHFDTHRSFTFGSTHNVAQCRIEHERPRDIHDDEYFNTTLVVVPRGPVFVQWVRALSQTNLKVVAIESLHSIRRHCPPDGSDREVIRNFFESFDVVLVKNTSLKTLMSYYAVPYRPHPIAAWARIMVDEAHEILNLVPFFRFKFIWLITATYQMLAHNLLRNGRNIVDSVRDVLSEERVHFLTVRGELSFVQKSFDVPQPVEHTVLCALPREYAAMHQFFTPALLERLNAGDFAGVISGLGGKVDTEDNVVDLLMRDVQREIRNKERELDYMQQLDIDAALKQQRIETIMAELERIRGRAEALRERITQLSEKTCPICYEQLENPIFLPCTHVYCAECLVTWMRANVGNQCPTCRVPIVVQKLIAVVNTPPAPVVNENTSDAAAPVSKEQTIVRIINGKPNGRFLIFSAYDGLFYRIADNLRERGIEACELKGSTPQMMRILQRFNEGSLPVILINTHHAASGIEITKATDVILAHTMGRQAEQCIGRAQRTGRTEQLHIHRLYYPHELAPAPAAAPA